MAPGKVVPGIEVLVSEPGILRGRRFAVLANHAAVTRDLTPAWQALQSSGGELVRLFAPEHGLWGLAQDMEAVGHAGGAHDLPVISLYGDSPATLRPDPGMLDDIDAVVVDLPDIGCRYYTFAATMAYVMEACAKAGVEVIVADRPNPIGGIAVEGGPVAEGCRSFVSEIDVPVRHGLTLGELALVVHSRCPELALTVVRCRGWSREDWADQTGLPWLAPSPNMPTLTTAAIYPGACLVEATNLSEGRGTTRPFQVVGAPWVDGEALAARLRSDETPGVMFRAVQFRPEFQKFAGQVCGGVEWVIVDRTALRPIETGVTVLAAAREIHPDRFAWRSEPYEFVADVPAVDLLTGSAAAREAIAGRGEPRDVFSAWRAHAARFAGERREVLLYGTSS